MAPAFLSHRPEVNRRVPTLDPSLVTHTFATVGDKGAGWFRIGAVQNAGLALALFGSTFEEAREALGEGNSSR